jgi:hypothetical protein
MQEDKSSDYTNVIYLFTCSELDFSIVFHILCIVGRGGRGAGTPTNRLFIGNLCYDTEQSSLQELFPGATDVFIPMNRDTGKGKGYVEDGLLKLNNITMSIVI